MTSATFKAKVNNMYVLTGDLQDAVIEQSDKLGELMNNLDRLLQFQESMLEQLEEAV